MPCNLAISITKAAVTDAARVALLTSEVVQPVLTQWLAGQVPRLSVSAVRVVRGGVEVQVMEGNISLSVSIERGKIRIDTERVGRAAADRLQTQLTELLGFIADRVTAQRIAALLGQFGDVTAQSVMVEDAGTVVAAQVLTLNVRR